MSFIHLLYEISAEALKAVSLVTLLLVLLASFTFDALRRTQLEDCVIPLSTPDALAWARLQRAKLLAKLFFMFGLMPLTLVGFLMPWVVTNHHLEGEVSQLLVMTSGAGMGMLLLSFSFALVVLALRGVRRFKIAYKNQPVTT